MLRIIFVNEKVLEIDVRNDPKLAKAIITLAVQANGPIRRASHIDTGWLRAALHTDFTRAIP